MLHSLSVALTIFALLVCPIRCNGGSVAASTFGGGEAKAAAARGCKCCARQRIPTEGRGSPAPREDDCACGNCLCHGAVTTPKVGVPALEPCEFVVASIAPDEMTRHQRSALLERDDFEGGASPRAGRIWRFELQSLLN